MIKGTIIISVYKNIRNLDLIFNALTIQTFKDFEVIVSDDGSGEEMNKFISEWKQKHSLLIKHVWQEDSGFRKNRILNESIRKSDTDYLIFIDGDCIPHSEFIEAHISNRENNTALFGRRVYLGEDNSLSLTEDKILSRKYEKINLNILKESLTKKEKGSCNAEEGIIIKNKTVRKLFLKEDVGILGSNFSLHKSLIEKINGFDENFIGPGYGEDTDVERRLRLFGAKIKSIRNLAVQYHLYHKKTVESSGNRDYYKKIKDDRNYFCINGLIKK